MTWQVNKDLNLTVQDTRGDIGGFARINSAAAVRTYIGPIVSPNGTSYWIEVDDAGVLGTTTTDPR